LAVSRTKIKEMEVATPQYNSQTGLSAPTITLQEKDIQAPSALEEIEEIGMKIEVEDVEKAQADTVSAVRVVKGRIIKSDRKRETTGQVQAIVEFEVAPEVEAKMREFLQTLGTVVSQESNRVQKAVGGRGTPADNKV